MICHGPRWCSEQQATADIAGGVLDGGQIEGLGLRPVEGNVVKVFGVGGDLLEDAPGGFDAGQILFASILTPTFVQQAVSAPDAFHSAMTEGKIELADETASPEGGQLLAQSDDLLFDDRGGFARLPMGSAGELD